MAKKKPSQLLDFYTEHNTSPVRQKFQDWEHYFQVRRALFDHLGIPLNWLAGKKILEVGAGSGFNSIHLASLGPQRLAVVDANPTGIREINTLFKATPSFSRRAKKIEIKRTMIEKYRTTHQFDLILCEGMLSSTNNPVPIAQTLMNLCAPSGIIVLTCTDPVQYFAEGLRRLFTFRINPSGGVHEQVKALLPIFTPHLKTLKGMTRRYDDWILDSLINTFPVAAFFSFETAARTMGRDFVLHGLSPRFSTDWRWYKNVAKEGIPFMQVALNSYFNQLHSFIDYRYVSPDRSRRLNQELLALTKEFYRTTEKYRESRSAALLKSCLKLLSDVGRNIGSHVPSASCAIEDAIGLLKAKSFDSAALARSTSIRGFFGRGQIFAAFRKEVA